MFYTAEGSSTKRTRNVTESLSNPFLSGDEIMKMVFAKMVCHARGPIFSYCGLSRIKLSFFSDLSFSFFYLKTDAAILIKKHFVRYELGGKKSWMW